MLLLFGFAGFCRHHLYLTKLMELSDFDKLRASHQASRKSLLLIATVIVKNVKWNENKSNRLFYNYFIFCRFADRRRKSKTKKEKKNFERITKWSFEKSLTEIWWSFSSVGEFFFACAAAYTEKSKIFRDKKWQNRAAREETLRQINESLKTLIFRSWKRC